MDVGVSGCTVNVKVAIEVENKALQLQKFVRYSSARYAWGKDHQLLRCNLLLVPSSTNYTVLLCLGRRSGHL